MYASPDDIIVPSLVSTVILTMVAVVPRIFIR